MTTKESFATPNACSVCSSRDISVFIEIPRLPVHCNLLWPSREEALQAPRGDIRLGFCNDCGHIYNLAFNPELMEYSQVYENSLHFSPRFQEYARSLASRLVERYDLHDKDIIEIGCGKGDFLMMLCELGGNRGVGFDPSYVPERTASRGNGQMSVIQDFYSERYAGYQADLICCRHVLEHVQFPRQFLHTVYSTMENKPETKVLFEVPNVMFMLRDLSIWDIIYEHCSYFSRRSLARLFNSCGFEVFNVMEAFEGQFLCIEALLGKDFADPGENYLDDPDGVSARVAAFSDRYWHKIGSWQTNLKRIEGNGQRAVIWGAGSKGVTFLNALGVQDEISHIVDINPNKHGKYVPGTGQRVVAPKFLREYQPDIVIVMNRIYSNEIKKMVNSIGIAPEIIPV